MTKTFIIRMPRFKLAYINSPRNGCTTMKYILADALGIDYKKADKRDIHRLFKSRSFPEFEPVEYLSQIPKTYLQFSIVRNPFDRVVSFYEGKIRQEDNPHKRDFYGVNRDISFPTFVRVLQKRGLGNLGTHLCGQHIGFRVPQLDYIIRFEFFEDDLQPILDRINYSKSIPHKNPSERRVYQEYYDRDTRGIVADLFRNDLEQLDYKF